MVTQAIAAKAEKLHAEGQPFKINIITGASTSDNCDGILARANAIGKRTPYQNHPDLRKRINTHDAHYFDLHLSEAAQKLRYGFSVISISRSSRCLTFRMTALQW